MCRKFTFIFTTNFVGSLDIRASREVFPIEVRSPEIRYIFIFAIYSPGKTFSIFCNFGDSRFDDRWVSLPTLKSALRA